MSVLPLNQVGSSNRRARSHSEIMKYISLSLLLACSLLTGCRSGLNSVDDMAIRSVKRSVSKVHVLAERRDESGVLSSWTLLNRGHDKASRIYHSRTFIETKPMIGLAVGPVTRERAQSIGVEPFKGVFVTEVKAGSPAEIAGVSVGDIISAVDGYALSSREQYEDYCQQNAAVDQGLQYSIRLLSKLGGNSDEDPFVAVEIIPTGLEEARNKNASFELEGSEAIYRYTGMRVGQLTPERSAEIYGEHKTRLLVTNVRVGSPAYFSGFRMGDRVMTCDGVALQSLDQLRFAVLSYLQARRNRRGAVRFGCREQRLGALRFKGEDRGGVRRMGISIVTGRERRAGAVRGQIEDRNRPRRGLELLLSDPPGHDIGPQLVTSVLLGLHFPVWIQLQESSFALRHSRTHRGLEPVHPAVRHVRILEGRASRRAELQGGESLHPLLVY
ncbi:MAG: hypothetical protein ACI87A_002694 [Planctomycetota bacterium]|jgi:hypothetical protein